MKMLDIFRLPVFSFEFEDHHLYKEEWSKFIAEYPYEGKRKKSHFSITTPNLHKNELFNPLRVFFLECLYHVLSELGMHHDMGLTSMWATNQTHSQYHHMHTHGNTFMAGVYYLNSDAESPSGTVFQNILSDFMMTRMNTFKKPKISTTFSYEYTSEFKEGRLVIFPPWLRHTTKLNKGEVRQVVAFNSMPIGITTGDQHDRYLYQDFRNMPMHGDEFD